MREALVTRTISYTRCEIMAVDTKTTEVSHVMVDYTGQQEDDEKMLKDIKKTWALPDIVLVKITKKETIEKLYGMKESDFIKYATPMETRTSKI